jgi:hypothetical protein
MKDWNWSTWKPPVDALAALGEIAKDQLDPSKNLVIFADF